MVVIATTHGDPRVRAGREGTEAFDLALAAYAEGRRHFVAATGTRGDPGLALVAQRPAEERRAMLRAGLVHGVSDDVARLAGASFPDEVVVVEGGHDEAGPLADAAAVAQRLHSPRDDLFRRRRVAMSRGDLRAAGYSDVRGSGLVRVDAGEMALARAMAARAAAAPDDAVMVASSLGAPVLCDALQAAGRGGQLVAGPLAAAALGDAPLWWGMLRAGLPEPGDDSLVPWARALVPYLAALKAWPSRDEVAARIEAEVGPRPPVLPPRHPLRRHVERAAKRLRKEGFDHAIDVPLVEASNPALVMSYDTLHDCVTVAEAVAELPEPLTAALLLHELVHVRQVSEACAVLGVTPRDLALALDTLPLGVGVGIRCAMEDLAYREEVSVLSALGLSLPDPAAPAGDGTEGSLLQLLAMLDALPYGSKGWLRLIDSLVIPDE